ncbi:MAG: hypothetical protein F6K23_36685 [Okeania sp. SIO2C9]|uniref:hypothetical protein n=1 Tax=Okeania sp. SIO2C9 TaxID=2607791 RepID=UPI0013BFB8D2|nr:hypothetical protein [Okeania sp. SIO2C9]NEQ78059.1 hypothetical protein [Okeania sp. SIO2C9]
MKKEEGKSGATPRRRQSQGNAHQERKKEEVKSGWGLKLQPIVCQQRVDGGVLNPKEKDNIGNFNIENLLKFQKKSIKCSRQINK